MKKYFAPLGIVRGETVLLHLLGHGAGLLYSVLHAAVQVRSAPAHRFGGSFLTASRPVSFWRQRRENINVRKGDFPTDGIVKKNLEKNIKISPEVGAKSPRTS